MSLQSKFLEKFGYIKRDPYQLKSAFAAQKKLTKKEKPLIFDVGAFTGQTVEGYKKIFPEAQIYSFEPFPESYEKLFQSYQNDVNVFTHSMALSHKDGTCEFHVNMGRATNSIFPPSKESHEWSPKGTMEHDQILSVPSMKLDTFCSQSKIAHIDILKIDAQGGERLILEGAENLLKDKKISLIYAEVLFVPLYDGQAYFHDVSSYLNKHGYSLFDLFNYRYSEEGKLKWADALFLSHQ